MLRKWISSSFIWTVLCGMFKAARCPKADFYPNPVRSCLKYWRDPIKIPQFKTTCIVLTNRNDSSVPSFWVKTTGKKWVKGEESGSQVSTSWDGFNLPVALLKGSFPAKYLKEFRSLSKQCWSHALCYGLEKEGKLFPYSITLTRLGGFSVNPPTPEMEEFFETCNSTVDNSSRSLSHIKPQLYHSTISTMIQSLMAVYSCSKCVIHQNTCLKHVISFIAKVMAHRPPWTELYMKHEVTDTTMTILTCMILLCSAHYCAAKPKWGYKVNTAAAGSNTHTQHNKAQVLGRLRIKSIQG